MRLAEAIGAIINPMLGGRLSMAVGLVAVVVLAMACRGGSDPLVITPSPTITPGAVGTITAVGKIAFINPSGELALTDPDGTAQQVLSDFDGVVAFEWSPAGSLIAAEVEEGGAAPIVRRGHRASRSAVSIANRVVAPDVAATSSPAERGRMLVA